MAWDEREQPILEAIRRREDAAGDAVPNLNALAEATGLERRTVLLGVRALSQANYVRVVELGAEYGTGDDDDYGDIALLERGRRASGQWPAEQAADALLELLDSRVAEADTDEDRTRWVRLRDAATGLGGRALQELTIAFLKHQAGL